MPRAGWYGIRPVINLKPDVEIISGTGTESDPYRLKGDDDTPTSGTKLATRYSGEYIRFGIGENNLYQIVSHEIEGTTKIVSTAPLKEDGEYKILEFGDTLIYSINSSIGSFLNTKEYLMSENYLTSSQKNMIEDNIMWYLGEVDMYQNYKLAKYTSALSTKLTSNTTTAKIGLLRLGELMPTQFFTYNDEIESD